MGHEVTLVGDDPVSPTTPGSRRVVSMPATISVLLRRGRPACQGLASDLTPDATIDPLAPGAWGYGGVIDDRTLAG